MASKDLVSMTDMTYDVQNALYGAQSAISFVNAVSEIETYNSGEPVIGYGRGKFIAVIGSDVAYSADGTIWEKEQNAWLDGQNWGGIAYGNNVFVLVPGDNYDGMVHTQGYVYDGNDWMSMTMPLVEGDAPDIYWRSVVYGDGQFVAVGSTGWENDDAGAVAISYDGFDWELVTNGLAGSCRWQNVVYGNGKFAALNGDDYAVYYSTDGRTWTYGGRPDNASGAMKLRFCAGKFWLLDYSAIHTSVDAITWSTTQIETSKDPHEIAFGNGVYVVYCATDCILYSVDGIYWEATGYDYGGSMNSAGVLMYGGGSFVCIVPGFADSGHALAIHSVDGVNWSTECRKITQGGENITGEMRELFMGASEDSDEGGTVMPMYRGGTGAADASGALSNFGIQYGYASNGGNTESQKTKDIQITFPKPYPAGVVPIVVVSFATTSTAYGMGRCSCTAIERSNTGFTIRFYNYDGNSRNPRYCWIAIGTPGDQPDAPNEE